MGVTTTVCIAVFCGLFVKALGDLPIYELDFLLSRDLSLQNLCKFAAKGVPCDRQIYNHNVADVDYSNQIQRFARRIRRRLMRQSPNEHIRRSVDSLLCNSRSVENIYELVHTGTFHNRQSDYNGPENQPRVFRRHHRASRGRSRSMSHPNIVNRGLQLTERLIRELKPRRMGHRGLSQYSGNGGEDYDEYKGHTKDKDARRLRELNAMLDLPSKTISLEDLGDVDYLDFYKDYLLQKLNQEHLRSKNISHPSLEANQNFTHTDQNFTENGHTQTAEQSQNDTENAHTRVVQQSQNDTENAHTRVVQQSQNDTENEHTQTAELTATEDGVPPGQPVQRIIVGGILMNIQQQQQEQIPPPPPNRAHQVNDPSPTISDSSITNNGNSWLNIAFLCLAVLFALIMSV